MIMQWHAMIMMIHTRHSKFMAWSSWNIARSWHDYHDNYYSVVWTLIIQLTLLISTHMVLRYFLTRNMLNEPIRNYPENVDVTFPKTRNYQKNNEKLYICYKITKSECFRIKKISTDSKLIFSEIALIFSILNSADS